MKTRDVMTPAPVSADPTTSLTAAAQLMSRYDCGSIPVREGGRPARRRAPDLGSHQGPWGVAVTGATPPSR